jgi:CHASE2 domain-containing sensor protein
MKSIYKKYLVKDAFLCTVMTFIVGGLLYFAFINISIFSPFKNAFKDFKFTDIYYSERFSKSDVNSNIILVNIQNANRMEIGQAIRKITENKPSAIGLDVIFKDLKNEFIDSTLKEEFQKNNLLVHSYYFDKGKVVKSNSFFNLEAKPKGFINFNHDGQHVVIRDFIGKDANTQHLAFASQLAITSGLADKQYIDNNFDKPIPINYVGNKDIFLTFSIDEILRSEQIPALKNAIVIMGYLGNENPQFDIQDKHFTPLNEAWVGRSVPDTYGTTIHANILNMIISKNLIYKFPVFPTYILAFVFSFFTILFIMKIHMKNELTYRFSKKLVPFFLSVVLLYLALLLLQSNIYLHVIPLILLPILCIEMYDFYRILIKYLNKKYKWESHIL